METSIGNHRKPGENSDLPLTNSWRLSVDKSKHLGRTSCFFEVCMQKLGQFSQNVSEKNPLGFPPREGEKKPF